MLKKFLSVISISLLLFLLVACNSQENEEATETSATEVEPVTNVENVDSSTSTTESTTNEQVDEETVGIDGEMLIKNAPTFPTNFEGIIAYPVGPYSGNSYYAKLDGTNSLTDEQLVEVILSTLPAFTAEDLRDPNYLDQWFHALHSLIAEDYRDPQAIMDEFSFEALGKLMINGAPIEFKDQLNVLIILDASGSMINTLNGETMMQIAQNELNALIDRLPEEVNIGLRVYGGQESNGSCASTTLIEPIASNNKDQVKAAINNVVAEGWTPIAESLKQAANDFANFSADTNTNLIYLISDGMETCEGDPVKEVQNLSASNITPIVNVIGFNVDAAGQHQLTSIAEQGNGQYVHVSNKQAFNDALKTIEQMTEAWTKRKHEIIDDALTLRGELENELRAFKKEWDNHIKDEYDAFMLIMDELNSTEYFDDLSVYGQAQGKLLDKISAKNNLYRTELDNKYDEIINNIDGTYESIVNSLN